MYKILFGFLPKISFKKYRFSILRSLPYWNSMFIWKTNFSQVILSRKWFLPSSAMMSTFNIAKFLFDVIKKWIILKLIGEVFPKLTSSISFDHEQNIKKKQKKLNCDISLFIKYIFIWIKKKWKKTVYTFIYWHFKRFFFKKEEN